MQTVAGGKHAVRQMKVYLMDEGRSSKGRKEASGGREGRKL